MTVTRRNAKAGVALFAALCLANAAAAEDAPKRTRIVNCFPAGDTSDAMIRVIAEKMQERLKRPVIVENMAGAGGRIGIKHVINSQGDGGTLLYAPMAPVTLNPITIPNLDYDPFKQLKPVSQVAKFDLGLAVGPKVPVKTLQDLVAWAKANPGKASYGVPGAGGLPNFFATMFATAAGLKVEKIPYRGTAPILNDMMAGHLPIAVTTTGAMMEMHRTGRIRILATASDKRSPFSPDVPTFKEAGFDLVGEGWFGVFAPASMPDATVESFSSTIRAILSDEAVRKQIQTWAYLPTGTTPQQLRDIQQADNKRWEPAIRASGFVGK